MSNIVRALNVEWEPLEVWREGVEVKEGDEEGKRDWAEHWRERYVASGAREDAGDAGESVREAWEGIVRSRGWEALLS